MVFSGLLRHQLHRLVSGMNELLVCQARRSACKVLVTLFANSTPALGDIAEHLSQLAWKIKRKERLTIHDQETCRRFSDEIKLALSGDSFNSK